MNLLLDTRLLLWAVVDSPRLPASARRLIANPSTDIAFSVASIWEIAIKHGRGRENFIVDPGQMRTQLLDRGFEEIAITGDHAMIVAGLPPIHRDPFDRLLLAQTMVEGLTLLTTDAQLVRYPGPIQRV